MSTDVCDHDFSFFCQYDNTCGKRSPNIHELRVAIASLEVPIEGTNGQGFLRYSTVYGCEDSGSSINIKSPECGVQANIRVKQVSTEDKCLLFIGDEGLWYRGVDLLTGHEVPLPAWTDEDNKLFDELYDYETQFLRYSNANNTGPDSSTAANNNGCQEDPYVTTHDLSTMAGLQRTDINSGTTVQYFTPNFSFQCLYEYSPYWNLSTSFIVPADSDDSGADDDASVEFHMQQYAREKRARSADRSPRITSKSPSPLPKRSYIPRAIVE